MSATDKELDELEAPPHRPQRKGNPMTPEEKPFDTSRIPVFYQNGSVKVGDKEYAPGEYPLGTGTTMTDVDTRSIDEGVDTSFDAVQRLWSEAVGKIEKHCIKDVEPIDVGDAAVLLRTTQMMRLLLRERDELERLAGDARELIDQILGEPDEAPIGPHKVELALLHERLTAYQRKNKGEGNG